MILVTGGTGFVGRRLVARLLSRGEHVRVLSRAGGELPGAEVVRGEVRDLAAVVPAARGCAAVVNLVGIIRERAGATFWRVHVEGTRSVVRACQEAGVERLVHMSALGARPRARSRYHRSKWEAEELVRSSGQSATIFRPSLIFGQGNRFLPLLRELVRRPPVIPVIGPGTALLQPVWVEDVVTCLAGALDRPETAGRSYELGGPETFAFEQLLDLLAERERIEKPKVHLPVTLMRLAAQIGRLVPGFPLTPDQLVMLLEDNTCDNREMREAFGLTPASLLAHLEE